MEEVKFLIVRFSSIGDIVLTTPVIRTIKQQVEGAIIHYLTKPSYKNVLKANPYIDKLHLLKENFSETVHELKYEHFDYIIDLHKNLRTLRLKRKLKVISFSFDKLNYAKWVLVNFKKNNLPDRHIVDRYLETAHLFDVKNDGRGLDFFISPDDEIDLNILPEQFHNGFVAIVVSAYHNTKRLTSEKILSICNKIEFPIVFLGGPENEDEGSEYIKNLGERAYNACGKYSISQSASMIKQANVVLTPDTGLMHIAAAFHKKIISIWGNTVPEFGMYPYRPHPDSEIFEIKDLKCRPCTKIGFRECPKKHFRCIKDIDENRVAEKIKELF